MIVLPSYRVLKFNTDDIPFDTMWFPPCPLGRIWITRSNESSVSTSPAMGNIAHYPLPQSVWDLLPLIRVAIMNWDGTVNFGCKGLHLSDVIDSGVLDSDDCLALMDWLSGPTPKKWLLPIVRKLQQTVKAELDYQMIHPYCVSAYAEHLLKEGYIVNCARVTKGHFPSIIANREGRTRFFIVHSLREVDSLGRHPYKTIAQGLAKSKNEHWFLVRVTLRQEEIAGRITYPAYDFSLPTYISE